jgi:hypothetical protein
VFDGIDPSRLWLGDTVRVVSGKAVGRTLMAAGVLDGIVLFAPGLLDDVVVGDEVQVDNRAALAGLYQDGFLADTDPFWTELGFPTGLIDGRPIAPQRAIPYNTSLLNFPTHSGRFEGSRSARHPASRGTGCERRSSRRCRPRSASRANAQRGGPARCRSPQGG